MKKILTITGISVFVLFCAFSAFRTDATEEPSPDTDLQRAMELRAKAMRGHCARIGTKISQCYSGDHSVCSKMQESVVWFTNEYGEAPEVACLAKDSPFGFGVVRR